MPPLFPSLRVLARALAASAALASLFATARAQSLLAPERVTLDSLAGFAATKSNWQLAGGLAGDPRRDKALVATPGFGVLVCNPGTTPETRGHLVTSWEHSDLELDLEFLLAPGSNSGVYLQGRYEIQLFDSWGVKTPTPADCGGLYARWDSARGAGKESFDGIAPRANAARAPGLWQKLHIEFQAPRFDAAGKKTKTARFAKVVLNGFTIHENIEATGPTRSSLADDEKPLGPLMIQGDHGSVALRRIAYKRFEPDARLAIENLGYELHAGAFGKIGDYDKKKPTSTGTPARFSHAAVEKNGKFALVLTGSLVAPRAGEYAFTPETTGQVRLLVDDRPVITSLERGGQAGKISLTAGAHALRLDYVHNGNNRPSLEIIAEGPGLAPQALGTSANSTSGGPRGAAANAKTILLEPTEGRVRMQRGFVPFEPKKRLYATSVGTPAGQHFAYDLETGSVLRVWRGAWLDTVDMWESRGEPQLAKPTGPSLTLSSKPTVAFIDNPKTAGWPETADAMQSSQGYILEADGLPVFLSKLSDLSIRDRLAPSIEGRGLERRLEFKGSLPSWETQVLLAEAGSITPQPGGKGWIIGDREYYIDWPAGAAQQPTIRTVGDKQLLVVRLARSTLEAPLSYSLVW
jgi:hypothetical protein